MTTDDSEARARAAARMEIVKAWKEQHPGIFNLAFYKSVFLRPSDRDKTPADRTKAQLKEARRIAAQELRCSPEDVSAEVVASIAQILATNYQTSIAERKLKK